MKKTLSLLLLLSLACSGMDAEHEDPAPVSGLCQSGMEAAEAWQGEYPGPVVHVMEAARLPSRAEPCGVIQGECAVPAGLYHPWASSGALGFVTIRPVLKYRVARDYTDEDGMSFSEGDIVEVTAYLGEGFCGMRINGQSEGGYCPGMFDETAFVLLNPEDEDRPETQLFKTPCEGGGEGWIEVGTALAAPGVEEGVIVGYGEVAPHGTAEGF